MHFMIDRAFVLSSVLIVALAGCASGTGEPRGSVGPESLTVTFDALPETVSAKGQLSARATARNTTRHTVFARWQSGYCGLTVRIFFPSGDQYPPMPPVCRGSGTWTMAPGEITSLENGFDLAGQPRGVYRVRAQVEAVGSQTPAIERNIIVVPP